MIRFTAFMHRLPEKALTTRTIPVASRPRTSASHTAAPTRAAFTPSISPMIPGSMVSCRYFRASTTISVLSQFSTSQVIFS